MMPILSKTELESLYSDVLPGMAALNDTQALLNFIQETDDLVKNQDKEKMDAYFKKHQWLDGIIQKNNISTPPSGDVIPSLNMLVSSIRAITNNDHKYQVSSDSSSGVSHGLFDWFSSPAWRPYPYSYGYSSTNIMIISSGTGGSDTGGHNHFGSDCSEGMLYVLVVLLIAILLVLAAALTIAATKEAYANLREIFGELANNQRVMANLATLTLTALAVGGVVALIASNPVGWGVAGVAIAAVSFYWLCVAALIVTRSINNHVDYFASKSIISGDSRFQLTQSEENKIRLSLKNKQGEAQIEDTIIKIKLSIKELANEVVCAGDKVDSKAVTQQLAKLKKGNLTDAPASHSGEFKLKFKEISVEQPPTKASDLKTRS